MDPWTIGLTGLNVVGSLLGGLGASRARRRAEEARARALQEYLISGDASLQALRQTNAQGLYGATGQAGDALRALGGSLGSALAASGIHNSSATAGALARAHETSAAQIGDLAARNYANEAELQAANRRMALAQQMGWSASDVEQARASETASQQGLISGLIGLASAFAPKQGQTGGKAAPTKAAPTGSVLNSTQATANPAAGLKLALPSWTGQSAVSVQPAVQGFQQGWKSMLGLPDPRATGPLVNGMQGLGLRKLALVTPSSAGQLRLRLW